MDHQKFLNRQSGSVFTVLLAGIGLTAALGISVYQLFTGPVSSVVRVTQKSLADTQLLSIAKIGIMDATNQAAGGDCDGDSFIEPRPWRDTTGNKPVNGGLVPLTMGAPVTDPWKSDYGYCVWDVGAASADAGCGGATGRLDGSNTPTAGNTETQTVMAIISAGPDRQFQTTCNAYVDATTDVITTGNDDIVLRFSYQEAAVATSSLWSLKVGDPTVAEIDKDLEIGNDIAIDTGAGLIQALAVNATGKVIAGGGVSVGDEGTVTLCDASQEGLIRFNSTMPGLEVCTGAGGWAAAASADPGLNTTTANIVITPGQQSGMDVDGTCGSPTCYGNNITFTVRNYGQTTTVALGASLTNTSNFEFVSNTCTGVTLVQYATCQIVVRAKANGNVSYNGNLQIAGDNNPFAIMSGTSSGFGCTPGRQGGGGIYAYCGLVSAQGTYDLIVTPGGCTATTSNPTCAGGSDTFSTTWGWNGISTASIPYNDAIGAQMSVDVMAASAFSSNIAAAVGHCDALVYNGYSDWYLPAVLEAHNYIRPNRTAIGGFITSRYWTSTPSGGGTETYWYEYVAAGWSTDPRSYGRYIRCARRHDIALPPVTADTNPDDIYIARGVTTVSGGRVSSPVFTISGILQTINVSISGASGNPKMKISGGAEVASGTAGWNSTVQFLMDAPAVAGTYNTATITLGDDTYSWDAGYADSAQTAHVFVTLTGIPAGGNFNGLTGADNLCTSAAVTAGIGGTWKAILSDSVTAAASRIPFNWGTLKRLDEVIVANSWTDLWDGSLQNPINVNENLSTLTTNVFTGSSSSGTRTLYPGYNIFASCDDWTAAGWSEPGAYGVSTSTSSDWIRSAYRWDCGDGAGMGIYCIEATPGGTDTTPTPFTIPYAIQVATSSRTTSSPVTIAGLGSGVSANVVLTGASGTPRYTVNGGAEQASDVGANVQNGDVLRLVMDAPATASSNNMMTVTVGAGSAVTWRVWTGDNGANLTKRVFTTSGNYTAKFGGVAGADAACQTAATGAGLGGTWKAIISGITEAESAINRIGYNWSTLVLVDGTTVVSYAPNFWTSVLLSPIVKTQAGATKANAYVWSNTASTGFPSMMSSNLNYNCYNWTSDYAGSNTNYFANTSATATAGIVTSDWITACSAQAGIFCIEQ